MQLQGLIWGSILPVAWSFCLAARDRGLGTCWTTLHLSFEREIADPRLPLDRVLHRERW